MSKLSHPQVLEQIKYGLIASCQPVDNGPMDSPEIVAAMAQASVIGGAAGLRIEGIENLKATRNVVNVPIIGIVKRDLPDSPVRISPFLQDIEELLQQAPILLLLMVPIASVQPHVKPLLNESKN